ncbi:MAG TPA: DUF5131 family protein, partial [Polyangiales bacterium]|nr:DUF5131 family protein [Polyangiales bacterium]
MAESSIEWTDATWNPVRGCARVSPGCENCYAERVAARFGAPGQPYEGLVSYKSRVSGLRYTNPKAAGSWTAPRWNGNARFVPEMLDAPLRWKKPRRIFVNSMSDLFHDDITNEQIAAVFGVMAACPQHTFQVLTKRPARMKAWFDKVREIGATVAAKLPRVQTSDPQRYTKLFIADQAEGILQRALWGCELEVTPPFAWPLPNVWLGVSAEDQQRADERIPLLLQTPAAVRFVSAEPLLG